MIFNSIVNKDNLKQDLIIFGQFDENASGKNGLEYVSETAFNNGFTTNLEYWADLAEKELAKTDDIEEAVTLFIDKLSSTWGSHYSFTEYSVTDVCITDAVLLTFVVGELIKG